MKSTLLICFTFLSFVFWASGIPPSEAAELSQLRMAALQSAERPFSSDYRSSLSLYIESLEEIESHRIFTPGTRESSFSSSLSPAALALEEAGELDLSLMPEWNLTELKRAFREIRDTRFIHVPEHADFLRRLSWLYPDDGCYARAAVANSFVRTSMGLERAAKLFAFGNLEFESAYAVQGKVYWWYHVAQVVRIGETPYVLDPAVQPSRALKVEEWKKLISRNPERVRLQVCGPNTYLPGHYCYSSPESAEASAPLDQERFLRLEWQRLENLDRNPENELGDSPPWN